MPLVELCASSAWNFTCMPAWLFSLLQTSISVLDPRLLLPKFGGELERVGGYWKWSLFGV